MSNLIQNIKLNTKKVTELTITFHNDEDAKQFYLGLDSMYNEIGFELDDKPKASVNRVWDLLNKYF